MAEVSLESVYKSFRNGRRMVDAVVDVSLSVADEEFVVLVGPSGCGKTTLLRLIAGLENGYSGTIKIASVDVCRVAPKDRDVAMVFQNYALYPHMTVFNNMAFGLKMRRTPKAEIRSRVEETAALLGIELLLDRKPAALSGGEQQRVALGRAIVRKPRVFLFDEPLSNLDALLRLKTRTEIKQLQRSLRATMIYVTHDQEEAMTLGDRIVVLNQGSVQQCGTPLDVYRTPTNQFVAGFLGNPPMNFLQGNLTTDDSTPTFSGAFGRIMLPEASARSLSKFAGQRVAIGIRPEHLRLSGTESRHPAGPAQPIDLGTMTVTLVEPLGDATNVHLTGPGEVSLTARVGPSGAVAGSTVSVQADATQLHVFAADSGERLNTIDP